ncbi:hypothetical protein J6590_073289 [Homalodisca vitripennis]|nr:hypothetical protein J6590_073289 [Homalodisca vitripennis]
MTLDNKPQLISRRRQTICYVATCNSINLFAALNWLRRTTVLTSVTSGVGVAKSAAPGNVDITAGVACTPGGHHTLVSSPNGVTQELFVSLFRRNRKMKTHFIHLPHDDIYYTRYYSQPRIMMPYHALDDFPNFDYDATALGIRSNSYCVSS